MIYKSTKWRPKRKAQRAEYFSHRTKIKVTSTHADYVPPRNALLEQDVTRQVPSRMNAEPFCGTAKTPPVLTVPGAVMAGHKQGYEFVTDMSLIAQMGKKTGV